MSADNEGDSHMLSSPDSSDLEPQHRTPVARTAIPSAALSPPPSQNRESSTSAMPTAASGASIANSNGKRPIQTISNGNDDAEELAAMANGKARQDFPTRTHQASGYTWSKAEDEPGYAWLNKKALDEYQRAWDTLAHKEHAIRDKYLDPFELAEKEQAINASLYQS